MMVVKVSKIKNIQHRVNWIKKYYWQEKKHPLVIEDIDESLIKEASLKTIDGFGLLGLDGDGSRKILVSKSYGTINADLTPLEEFLA